MAPEGGYTLVFQCILMAGLGLLASYVVNQWSTAVPGLQSSSPHLQQTCKGFIEKTKLLPGMRMSTKTPYQFDAPVKDESLVDGCSAVQLYAVFRHGSRFPKDKYIPKWNDFQAELEKRLPKGAALTPTAAELSQWKNPFTVQHGAETRRGLWEQYCLGKRFQERFPKLLVKNYSADAFSFRSTQKSRTVRSALSFAQGMFEDTGPLNGYQPIDLESTSLDQDFLLRFFDEECPLYDERVTNNETLSAMLKSYLNSSEMNAVVKNVQSLIDPGQQLWNLTTDDVVTMYEICIHEVAVFRKSNWCSLFKDDMAVVEYYNDFKAYWKKAYGFDIVWKRSIPLVRDIMDTFQESTKQNVTRQMKLRFAHAETLLPLAAFFGLFKDNVSLLLNNYEEMKNRNFALRNVVPFSSSAVFVLYDCSGSGVSEDELFKVRLLFNESPITIPSCNSSLCPLNTLLQYTVQVTGGQNFTQMCSL